jgi:hypothetical protein
MQPFGCAYDFVHLWGVRSTSFWTCIAETIEVCSEMVMKRDALNGRGIEYNTRDHDI